MTDLLKGPVNHTGKPVTDRMKDVAKLLAKQVGSTMGPDGQLVMIREVGGQYHLTCDGVTVSKEFQVKDLLGKGVAQLIQEAATKTVGECGDGTTTATVIACRTYLHILDTASSPREAKRLAKQILAELPSIVENIAKQKIESTPEKLKQIAMVSGKADEGIAVAVVEAVEKLGKDAMPIIEATTEHTQIITEYESGSTFNTGFIDPRFATDARNNVATLENAMVLISQDTINNQEDVMHIMNYVAAQGQPLLIISPGINNLGTAYATLITNNQNGRLKSCAVLLPGETAQQRNEEAKDLAFITGATVVGKQSGIPLREMEEAHLGTIETAVVYQGRMILRYEENEDMEAYVDGLRVDNPTAWLKNRIVRLGGGIVKFTCGGNTALEAVERQYRLEDAYFATRTAAEHGVVEGGGLALIKATRDSDLFVGIGNIPHTVLRENAGLEDNVDLEVPEEVIDPLYTVQQSLINGVSIACQLASTVGAIL